MNRLAVFLPLTIIALGCANMPASEDGKQALPAGGAIRFAKGFSIVDSADQRILRVYNPWQGASNVVFEYPICLASNTGQGNSAPGFTLQVPLKRLVCLSSSHIAFINALQHTSSIVGISGSGYITNSEVRRRIETGEIRDVGWDQNLNYELILSLKPDAVICYGVSFESVGSLNKLKELGLKLIFVGDYLEENPLGKAEWIKFFGALLGSSHTADSIYNEVEKSYITARNRMVNPIKRPKVFLNLPWRDTWYFPGSSSYFVRLIEDAGGEYVFSNLQGSKTYPISFERALQAGLSAEVWLNPGTMESFSELKAFDERLAMLPSFQKGWVYNNNLRSTKGGGNDFWESGTLRPDLILMDLITILHPEEKLPHELYYYQILR